MSVFYNPKRSRNLYDPKSDIPFRLSRSKIDLFFECPRCFYIDRRLGVGRPPGYPFTLNSAVDKLLKKEFDIYRLENKAHPLAKTYNLEAVPFRHEKMDEWRDNFKGVACLHEPTNFMLFGAIDDIWIVEDNYLAVVDYKATSTEKGISLDDEWKQVYKRQMEFYQWLCRHNNVLKDYKISDTGYFVYCNGLTDKHAFDGKLDFTVEILPYKGSDDWVEDIVLRAHKCLSSDEVPEAAPDCDYCRYREAVKSVL